MPIPYAPIPYSLRRGLLALGAAAALTGALAAGAQQISARNVFWSATDLVDVSQNPVSGAAKPSGPAGQPSPPARSATAAGRHLKAEQIARSGYGDEPRLVHVSGAQIGIRYALLLRGGDGHYSEVSPATIFHSGDHLRLSVMANQPGYLYVIEQGSSGSWSSIFPAQSGSDPAQAANRIEAGHLYQIPDGRWTFRFDQNPGQERLFLVLSREPVADLEGALNSLKPGGQHPAAPSDSGPPAAQGAQLAASFPIPDAFVKRLAGRDLILAEEETVDPSRPGSPAGEKAVYVVRRSSASTGGSQRVVASVTLRHD